MYGVERFGFCVSDAGTKQSTDGWLPTQRYRGKRRLIEDRSMVLSGMPDDYGRQMVVKSPDVVGACRVSRAWELRRELPESAEGRTVDLLAAYHKLLPEFCNAGRWPQDAAGVKDGSPSSADRRAWRCGRCGCKPGRWSSSWNATAAPVQVNHQRGGPE